MRALTIVKVFDHEVRTACGSGRLMLSLNKFFESEINRPLPQAVLTSHSKLEKQRSAININRLSVYAAPFFGSQQQCECGNFFGCDHSILRAHAFEGLDCLVSRDASSG